VEFYGDWIKVGVSSDTLEVLWGLGEAFPSNSIGIFSSPLLNHMIPKLDHFYRSTNKKAYFLPLFVWVW
jgi:hypothetical protein